MKKFFFGAAAACLIYYLVIGFYARFGMSLSWIWLAGCIVFALCGVLAGCKKLPKALRIAWRALLIAGIAFVMALEGCVISRMNDTPSEPVGYVIVLGARVETDGQPSKALKHRIDAAAGYLKQNPDAVAVASGGAGADEVMTEAECIRAGLVAAGIDESRILIEDRSTDTGENIRNTLAVIGSEAPVAVVTNNFHVFRSIALAKHAGFTSVSALAAEYTGPMLPHYMIREAVGITVDFLRGRIG